MVEKKVGKCIELDAYNDFVKHKEFRALVGDRKLPKECLQSIEGLTMVRDYLYHELVKYSDVENVERRFKPKCEDDLKRQIGKYWQSYKPICEAYDIARKALKDEPYNDGDGLLASKNPHRPLKRVNVSGAKFRESLTQPILKYAKKYGRIS